MTKQKKSWLIIIGIIIIAMILLSFGKIGSTEASNNNSYISARNNVAVINVIGTICEDDGAYYNQNWLLNMIEEATYDDDNLAILLYIDSPGGTVYEADEAYLALMKYKELTGRPIFAYMASQAASGGYYIACAADVIYANRNTLTGSIGVIMGNSIDLTGLFEQYGIKVSTVHAGKNKNMLNYNEPLTQEQMEIMQSIADECYDQFVGIVAERREMTLQQVTKLADGRVYTAKQALENGLIDAICGEDQIEEAVSEQLEMLDRIHFNYLVFNEETTLWEDIMGVSAKQQNIQADITERLYRALCSGSPAYYCPM